MIQINKDDRELNMNLPNIAMPIKIMKSFTVIKTTRVNAPHTENL